MKITAQKIISLSVISKHLTGNPYSFRFKDGDYTSNKKDSKSLEKTVAFIEEVQVLTDKYLNDGQEEK